MKKQTIYPAILCFLLGIISTTTTQAQALSELSSNKVVLYNAGDNYMLPAFANCVNTLYAKHAKQDENRLLSQKVSQAQVIKNNGRTIQFMPHKGAKSVGFASYEGGAPLATIVVDVVTLPKPVLRLKNSQNKMYDLSSEVLLKDKKVWVDFVQDLELEKRLSQEFNYKLSKGTLTIKRSGRIVAKYKLTRNKVSLKKYKLKVGDRVTIQVDSYSRTNSLGKKLPNESGTLVPISFTVK